jgi:uncharacterized OB-fold protein
VAQAVEPAEPRVISAFLGFLSVPYQTAIVALDGGGRVTARVLGDRVAIGDRVAEAEPSDGIPFFRKA